MSKVALLSALFYCRLVVSFTPDLPHLHIQRFTLIRPHTTFTVLRSLLQRLFFLSNCDWSSPGVYSYFHRLRCSSSTNDSPSSPPSSPSSSSPTHLHPHQQQLSALELTLHPLPLVPLRSRRLRTTRIGRATLVFPRELSLIRPLRGKACRTDDGA